jgi:hypothetical protein
MKTMFFEADSIFARRVDRAVVFWDHDSASSGMEAADFY